MNIKNIFLPKCPDGGRCDLTLHGSGIRSKIFGRGAARLNVYKCRVCDNWYSGWLLDKILLQTNGVAK